MCRQSMGLKLANCVYAANRSIGPSYAVMNKSPDAVNSIRSQPAKTQKFHAMRESPSPHLKLTEVLGYLECIPSGVQTTTTSIFLLCAEFRARETFDLHSFVFRQNLGESDRSAMVDIPIPTLQ